MTPATLEAARAAKVALRARLLGIPELRGVGIAVLDDGYALNVLLERLPAERVIPSEVDGVSVIIDVVGELSHE
jgi:hypothetical protein